MIPKTNYSQTLSITKVQRDSIYNKIERGKVNAERVGYLNEALSSCDSVKALQVLQIGILQFQNNTKDIIISNDKTIIKSLKENSNLEKKRGRKKAFWSFMKGAAVGAAVIGLIAII